MLILKILSKFDLINPNCCPLCRQDSENMDHLFIHSRVTKLVWNKFLSFLGTNEIDKTYALFLCKYICNLNLKTKRGNINFNTSVAICWTL